jgi:hypothetical protein
VTTPAQFAVPDGEPKNDHESASRRLDDAGADAVNAGGHAANEQGGVQSERLLRSGVDPAEAARLRWARHRERQVDENAEAVAGARVITVRVRIDQQDILSKLHADARQGDVRAARELRAWLERLPQEDSSDLSALDARTRAQVLQRILAEIVAEEGQLPEAPDGWA